VREQLKELWRRFRAHRSIEQALFLAVPVGVTLLIVVGTLLLAEPTPAPGPAGEPGLTPTRAVVTPATTSPAGPVSTGGTASSSG
jgi:hypothetical protein